MIDKTNNQEVITELKRISDIVKRFISISGEVNLMDTEFDIEKETINDQTINNLNDFGLTQEEKFNTPKPKMPAACVKAAPSNPSAEIKFDGEPASKAIKNLYISIFSGFGIPVGILLWIMCLIFFPDAILLVLLIVAFELASIILWGLIGNERSKFYLNWLEKRKKYQEDLIQWKIEFNNTPEEQNRFLNEFKEYDKRFLEYVKTCDDHFAEENQKFKDRISAMLDEQTAKINDWEQRHGAVKQELNEVTLIHEDHIHLVDNILANLQSGRADNLKEALNIAIDDERKDNEEATRQAEAHARQEALEQQAHDNMIHNMAMQRIAEEEARATAIHNAAMERAAQDQAEAAQASARAAEQQRRDSEAAARKAQSAAQAKCHNCANSRNCPPHIRNNPGNCAGYTPRPK